MPILCLSVVTTPFTPFKWWCINCTPKKAPFNTYVEVADVDVMPEVVDNLYEATQKSEQKKTFNYKFVRNNKKHTHFKTKNFQTKKTKQKTTKMENETNTLTKET